MVREHGLRTMIPSDAVVASGGVDFFLAGVERTVGQCAKLGVHSWDDDAEDGSLILGNEVSRDHPIHTMFLDYYEDVTRLARRYAADADSFRIGLDALPGSHLSDEEWSAWTAPYEEEPGRLAERIEQVLTDLAGGRK